MKKMKNTHNRDEKKHDKKPYISPALEVTIIEMEFGLAINSAAVMPLQVNSNTAEVQTSWKDEEETTYTSW